MGERFSFIVVLDAKVRGRKPPYRKVYRMSMTRIGANLSAMRSMDRLFLTNREIRRRLIRLASGKRINRVDEDPAGFSLARGLESRGRSPSA